MLNVVLESDVCWEFICFHLNEAKKWGKPDVKALKQIPIQAQYDKEQHSGSFSVLYATFPRRGASFMCY